MYHNTCYKIAIRPIQEQQPEDSEKTCRSLLFEKIQRFVKEEIIQKGHIYRVNELIDLYKRLQEEEGLENVGCENRSVKQGLQNAFPQDLSFMSSPGKNELMLCENSKQHLKSKRIDETVKEVGQAIRNEIQEATPMFSSWPPDLTEI